MNLFSLTGRRLALCCLLAGQLALASLSIAAAEEPATKTTTPRLVVVISVDQLVYDYLERFGENFAEDGFFRRVERSGANFTNCHHDHAYTFTGPGHSVMMTGAYPNATGIIDNDWFDRKTGGSVYCMSDSTCHVIGQSGGKPMSPRNLLAPTMGDVLKEQTKGKAKVFGLSLKDRAGILLSGHKADAAFWFDAGAGNWVSSDYYGKELPEYVRRLNASGAAKRFASAEWKLLHDKSKYHLRRPDDNRYEHGPYGLGESFPHAYAEADSRDYFGQVSASPAGGELTIELARLIVTREELGQDDVPDVLGLGLSSNDYVGHYFGPNSLEVEDMTYRTDLLLGDFVRFLDKQVGAGRWTLFLTSDHGVAPIPEYAASIGLPGKRDPLGDRKKLTQQLEAALASKFGPPTEGKTHVQVVEDTQVFLNVGSGAIEEADFNAAQQLVRDVLAKTPAIHTAVTREQLLAGDARGMNERLWRMFRHAFNAERSGDVLFVLQPYQFQGTLPATHGSPWEYDTHVPMFVLGSGVKPGSYSRAVSPAGIAGSVAKILSLPVPTSCVASPLAEAFSD